MSRKNFHGPVPIKSVTYLTEMWLNRESNQKYFRNCSNAPVKFESFLNYFLNPRNKIYLNFKFSPILLNKNGYLLSLRKCAVFFLVLMYSTVSRFDRLIKEKRCFFSCLLLLLYSGLQNKHAASFAKKFILNKESEH